MRKHYFDSGGTGDGISAEKIGLISREVPYIGFGEGIQHAGVGEAIEGQGVGARA